MFLFKKEHVEGIVNGTKTQTRRMHLSPRARVGSVHQCRTIMMRRDSCFARIKILRVWPEELQEITEEDAQAEGGYTPKEFITPPENLRARARYFEEDCVGCGACAQVCPTGAISVDEVARIDRAECTGCGQCVAECPEDALSLRKA